MTALMFAAEYGNFAMVDKLLNHDYNDLHDATLRAQLGPVNVNATNNDLYTALILAAGRGHSEVVSLISSVPGVDLGMKNKFGVNALMAAAKKGDLACVEILCQWTERGNKGFRFKVDDISHRGSSAMMLASREGHIDVVKYLFDVAGANVYFSSGSKSVRQTTGLNLAVYILRSI
jgi:ankyrin repeat protein